MSPLLEAFGIRVRYGQIAVLNGVSFAVSPGETVALVGANGAGKTTLIKTIMGLLNLASGQLLFDGGDIGGVPAFRRARAGIGYAPEGRRIFPGLSVRENLEVASYDNARGTSARIEHMYELFPGLLTKNASLGWMLSGGQQQMLAIARALMSRPRLLLLDEPSLGLSPKLTDEVLGRIPSIAKTGTAVILAEQNMSKALEIAQRAYVLRVGSIVLEGAASELRNNPAIRDSFLGGL